MKKRGCLFNIAVIFLSLTLAWLVFSLFDDASFTVPLVDDGGYTDTGEPIDTDTTPDKADLNDDEDDSPFGDTAFVSSSDFKSYYSQLNAEEKRIYQALYTCAKNSKSEVVFENVDCNAYKRYCKRAMWAMTYDHPELFWVRCGYSYTGRNDRFKETGTFIVEPIYYSYWQYTMNKQKKIDEFEAAVDKVVAEARRYEDGMERIRFVHDHLIENAYYDHDGLDEYYKTNHDASCEYIFSAYGALVNGKTVCSGYAKAFQYIMQKLGYDCLYVVGDAGESHGWNCIFIENEGYYVDVTWDDPDFSPDVPLYNYYCITSDALQKTHELDRMFETPVCTATEYNYFEYYGYRLSKYDFDAVSDIFEKQSDAYSFSVQFESLAELEKAYNELRTSKIYRMPVFNNVDGLSFTYNEHHRTFTVYIK